MTDEAPDVPSHSTLFGSAAVCRLGLATRGNTSLPADAVLAAIDRGINYLNWCGHPDGLQEAIRQLGPRRSMVQVAVQLKSRTADRAARELDAYCEALQTEYLDVATYYYVEHREEWQQITGRHGAAHAVARAKERGQLRRVGLTSHQRPLAAELAQTGELDLLMIRYNAAHRGAERDVFPVTRRLGLPVVGFTCTRWGALARPTPDDPPQFRLPQPPDWYRFALQHPDIAVALMAPHGASELQLNLELLESWRPLAPQRYRQLAEHGDRVRRHVGQFP